MHLTEHKRSLGRDANSNAAWIFSVIPSDGMHKSGPQKIIQGLTKPMMVSFCCRKERNSCFQGTLAVRPHWWYSCKPCKAQVKKEKRILYSTNTFRPTEEEEIWTNLSNIESSQRPLTVTLLTDASTWQTAQNPTCGRFDVILVLGIFAQVAGLKIPSHNVCLVIFAFHKFSQSGNLTWHSSSLIPNAETVAKGLPDSSRVTWIQANKLNFTRIACKNWNYWQWK